MIDPLCCWCSAPTPILLASNRTHTSKDGSDRSAWSHLIRSNSTTCLVHKPTYSTRIERRNSVPTVEGIVDGLSMKLLQWLALSSTPHKLTWCLNFLGTAHKIELATSGNFQKATWSLGSYLSRARYTHASFGRFHYLLLGRHFDWDMTTETICP